MLNALKRKFRKSNIDLFPAPIQPADHAPKLYNRKDLKLNLGCAGDLRVGFANIDCFAEAFANTPSIPGAERILYDLTQNLPADDNSCTFIYSSHFFEHIEYQQLKNLLKECYRVLTPGSEIRIAMPNFPKLLKAYIERDEDFYNELVDIRNEKEFRMPIDEVKWADIVSLGLYEWGDHKYFYDPEKFVDMLQRTGFMNAREVEFDSTHDLEYRKPHSFYVSAIK